MSVAKDGSRRPQLRPHQQRHPPPGDLPPRRGRHHGRGRRGQRPPRAPSHRIPAATTRSSPSRPSPTPTASPAASAATAATRGAATTRTTRSPTSATTAATSTSSRRASASGRRCPGRLRLHVRDVDGGARGHRRGRALQVEPAGRDAGRGPEALQLPRQPQLEDLDRPGPYPREAARRLAARAARHVLGGGRRRRPRSARPAGHDRCPITLVAQLDLLRAGRAPGHVAAAGWTAALRRASLHRAGPPTQHAHRRRCPNRTPAGTYRIGVIGTNQGRTDTDDRDRRRRERQPTAPRKRRRGHRRPSAAPTVPVRVQLAGRHRPVQRRSPATRSSCAATAARGAPRSRAAPRRAR